ncbi:hypothetical protein J7L87_04185, partial [bacterium]|nr:hypothetical protein [bacterium]
MRNWKDGVISVFFFLCISSLTLPYESPQYLCVKATTPVIIDGDLREWKDIVGFPLTNINFPGREKWEGQYDLSAFVKAMWDEANFYLAVKVLDDVHLNLCPDNDLYHIWEWDSVQIGFDIGNDTIIPGYDENDCELGFALTSCGKRAYRFHGQNPGRIPLENIVGSVQLGVKRDEKRKETIYEIAIPWDDFVGTKGSPPKIFGFNIVVIDSDKNSSEGEVYWTPGISVGGKNPTLFGKFRLVEKKPVEGAELQLELKLDREIYSNEEKGKIYCYVTSTKEYRNVMIKTFIEREGEKVELVPLNIVIKKGSDAFMRKFPLSELRGGRYSIKVRLVDASGNVLAKAEKSFVKVSLPELRERLRFISEVELPKLKQIIEKAKGVIDVSYPQVTLQTGVIFVKLTELDIENGELERALNTVQYLESRLREVKLEMKEMLNHPEKVRKVYEYDPTKPVKIKEGEFYQNGRPVILVGILIPEKEMGGIYTQKKLGFNAVLYPFDVDSFDSMGFVLRTPQSLKNPAIEMANPQRYPFIKAKIANIARECGLAIFTHLYSYRLPKWVIQEYPDLPVNPNLIDINNPHYKEIVKVYLK